MTLTKPVGPFAYWVLRPCSVFLDLTISAIVGALVFLLIVFVFGFNPVMAGIGAGIAGCVSAAVYIRARFNLVDPTPAFNSGKAPKPA